MSFDDIIAYVGDGEYLCPDCGDDENDTPIFETDEPPIGATCGDCGSCLVAGRSEIIAPEWYSREDAVNPEHTRWARCPECNGKYPYQAGVSAHIRLNAMRGKLRCPSCRGAVHF